MSTDVTELFALPVGLYPAYKVDGQVFYSSDKLKQSFLIAISKSSRVRHVSANIEKLVNQNTIIPCFKSKNILSFIKHKFSRNPEKNVVAFYLPDDKKVLVIIDNDISLFGTSANDELALTTLHECMHLVAGRNYVNFLKVFRPYLDKFYKNFFENYFKSNLDKKDISNITIFISKLERYGFRNLNQQLKQYYDLLDKIMSNKTKLSRQDFKIRLTKLIVAIKLLVANVSVLLRNYHSFTMVFTSLNNSYKKSFGKSNTQTVPIQESIALSEVAAIFSEIRPTDPVIKRLFKLVT